MELEPYKVTILVPIYGVEPYIERCAVSLLEQTYHNIEYVFVNDCTKDASMSILENVIERYPQRKEDVHIINNKSNLGIASTRNIAIRNVNGDGFMFVDSDDWVEPTLVEKCVKCQNQTDADVVTVNYFVHDKSGVYTVNETNEDDTYKLLIRQLSGKCSSRLWGRLFNRKLLYNEDVKFVDGANFAEDEMMLSFLWYYSKKHALIIEALYNYERRNVSSYTNNFKAINSIQSLINLDMTRLFFERHSPNLLSLVDFQELGKITGHMILCSKNIEDKNYYNNTLLSRLDSINREYIRQLPVSCRVIIYLRHFELVRLYVRIGGIIKKYI